MKIFLYAITIFTLILVTVCVVNHNLNNENYQDSMKLTKEFNNTEKFNIDNKNALVFLNKEIQTYKGKIKFPDSFTMEIDKTLHGSMTIRNNLNKKTIYQASSSGCNITSKEQNYAFSKELGKFNISKQKETVESIELINCVLGNQLAIEKNMIQTIIEVCDGSFEKELEEQLIKNAKKGKSGEVFNLIGHNSGLIKEIKENIDCTKY
jgi:hypothetical protein